MKPQLVLIITVIFILLLAYNTAPRNYYSEKHPILDQVKERFKMIKTEYGKIPLRLGNKSYTENKKAITLCIVDPEKNDFYDINTIMYVALHELAHVITPFGLETHGEKFKENFSNLLRRAHQIRVYDSTKPIPMTYCGVNSETDE